MVSSLDMKFLCTKLSVIKQYFSPEEGPGNEVMHPDRSYTWGLSHHRGLVHKAGRGLVSGPSLALGGSPPHLRNSGLIRALPRDGAIILKLFSRTPYFTLSHCESSLKKPWSSSSHAKHPWTGHSFRCTTYVMPGSCGQLGVGSLSEHAR